jgi:hypothetical protein
LKKKPNALTIIRKEYASTHCKDIGFHQIRLVQLTVIDKSNTSRNQIQFHPLLIILTAKEINRKNELQPVADPLESLAEAGYACVKHTLKQEDYYLRVLMIAQNSIYYLQSDHSFDLTGRISA